MIQLCVLNSLLGNLLISRGRKEGSALNYDDFKDFRLNLAVKIPRLDQIRSGFYHNDWLAGSDSLRASIHNALEQYTKKIKSYHSARNPNNKDEVNSMRPHSYRLLRKLVHFVYDCSLIENNTISIQKDRPYYDAESETAIINGESDHTIIYSDGHPYKAGCHDFCLGLWDVKDSNLTCADAAQVCRHYIKFPVI